MRADALPVHGRWGRSPYSRVNNVDMSPTLKIKETATLPLHTEADIYAAVGLGRVMVDKVGFKHVDRLQLETIIIELSFNALRHGSEGTLSLSCLERVATPIDSAFPTLNPSSSPAALAGSEPGETQLGLEISVGNHRSGVIDLAKVLAGRGDSLGSVNLQQILSVCQLGDEFAIDNQPGHGIHVSVRKWSSTPCHIDENLVTNVTDWTNDTNEAKSRLS
ncbi:MAG: hypothetical protein JW850_21170 [Thermoflexales bacterium]|nr:hypothetical protein [Thermoflexales bacterium]